jgi:site-specific DNA recombinase
MKGEARTDDLSKRPAFRQMLNDAEASHFDVVVVHKLDRFARNLRVTLETLDRLERVGVGFVSISETMDFSTPMGRMVSSTMGGLAQFYSDNLSNETKNGKRERTAQGLCNGVLLVGTRKGEDGIPVVDPATHPGLVLAFALGAGGKTDREIARALNNAGHRTTGNHGANLFTKDSVREFLQNRFYLGELSDGNGGWLPAKHAALIDAATFAAAKDARVRNATRPRRVRTAKRSPWAFFGVARYACGASMTAYGHADGRHRVQFSRHVQTKDCDAPPFFAEIVEEQIGTFLQGSPCPSLSERDCCPPGKCGRGSMLGAIRRGNERASSAPWSGCVMSTSKARWRGWSIGRGRPP